jgi:hypothetical protein
MRGLALLLLAALSAFGADIAGKWKAIVENRNGMRDITFVFEVRGDKLSGTAASDQGQAPIVDGKIEGDKISFTVEKEDFKAVLTGTISGDDMKLNAAVGNKTFDLPVKRVKD